MKAKLNYKERDPFRYIITLVTVEGLFPKWFYSPVVSFSQPWAHDKNTSTTHAFLSFSTQVYDRSFVSVLVLHFYLLIFFISYSFFSRVGELDKASTIEEILPHF